MWIIWGGKGGVQGQQTEKGKLNQFSNVIDLKAHFSKLCIHDKHYRIVQNYFRQLHDIVLCLYLLILIIFLPFMGKLRHITIT